LERERKKERKSRKSRHLLFLVSKKKTNENKTQFSAHEQKYKERADVRTGRCQKADIRKQISERADVREQMSESRYLAILSL